MSARPPGWEAGSPETNPFEEKMMAPRTSALLIALCGLLTHSGFARADVIITLEAFGSNGQPISGAVAPGTDVVVDILLSADGEHDPVPDVRLIQFDFDATGSGIQLVSFTWTVDANGYSFQDPDLPLTNVTSIYMGSAPGLLALTANPVKVASVEITIDGSGTLDLVNPTNTDPNYGADVRAGFGLSEPQEQFTFMAGNLQGGSLAFSVTGNNGGGDGGGIDGTPQPNDQDGDGVPDDVDAFPDDPGEDTDTDSNGVGDNEDPGDDGDAVPDDPNETTDSDGDGIGNNADTDDDNDGIPNEDDDFPLDPNGGGPEDEQASSSSSPRMCGAGMLGSSMLMLMGLGLMSYRPRWAR